MAALPLLTAANVMLAVLLLSMLATALYLSGRARHDPLLRMTDIMTGDNGRYASTKVFQAGAFAISSWAFVYFCLTGVAGETMLIGYMAVWAGAYAVNKYTIGTVPASTRSTTTTTSSTSNTPAAPPATLHAAYQAPAAAPAAAASSDAQTIVVPADLPSTVPVTLVTAPEKPEGKG